MNTALLQLRMRAFDAEGDKLPRFTERLEGVITLAKIKGEASVAHELIRLHGRIAAMRESDPRSVIYAALDRAQAHLSAA